MFTQTEVLVIQGRENTRCSAKFKFKLMTRCIQYWKRRHVLDASWCWDTLTNIKLRVQVDSVNVQTAVRRWYGFDRHRALDQSLNSSLVLECVTWHPCSHESQCWGMWEKKNYLLAFPFFFFFFVHGQVYVSRVNTWVLWWRLVQRWCYCKSVGQETLESPRWGRCK